MRLISRRPRNLVLFAMLTMAASGSLIAQEQDQDLSANTEITVNGTPLPPLSEMAQGPQVEGIVSARNGDEFQVTAADGTNTMIALIRATEIKASGGFLGLDRNKLASSALLNGLPVTVDTLQWDGGLVASKISLKNKDLKTAAMIRGGTDQRFAEQGAAIGQNSVAISENAAATEALRGRVGDIDKYNVTGTTNVYFDTGKWNLTPQAEQDLCAAASEANATDNALLLVVGYTDSVGNEDYNQILSERRAGRVVNYLQQRCGWKPWRMLTPTGMAEADPAASNDTAQGKAQNRRVSVNILVSKAIDGL